MERRKVATGTVLSLALLGLRTPPAVAKGHKHKKKDDVSCQVIQSELKQGTAPAEIVEKFNTTDMRIEQCRAVQPPSPKPQN